MEPLHVGISHEIGGNPSHNFKGYFFGNQVIRGVDGQFHEFKGGGITLRVHNADKSHRLAHRSKKRHDVVFLDSRQVPCVDIVCAELAVPRLVAQGNHLAPNDGPVVEKMFKKVAGLHGIRKVDAGGRRHLVGRKREGRRNEQHTH